MSRCSTYGNKVGITYLIKWIKIGIIYLTLWITILTIRFILLKHWLKLFSLQVHNKIQQNRLSYSRVLLWIWISLLLSRVTLLMRKHK